MIECDPLLNGRVIGVFAADRLPKVLPHVPFGFIANTDVHNKSGRHWIAVFSDVQGHFDFFDTYGRTPAQNSPYFKRWLDTKANTVQINRIQIQSDHSTLCGLYCILFLRQRLTGHTYQDFLNIFDASALGSNDSYVADTMLNAYSHCVGNEHDRSQTCTSLLQCF